MSDCVLEMKAGEFIRRIEKLGKERGVAVRFERSRGKGSHGTLYYGSRFTVVIDRRKELKTGTLHGMLQQLGLAGSDLV